MNSNDTRAESLVREFFETLNRADLEALRGQLHEQASWEATGTSIPGAGVTRGRDRIIDEFLAPVRGLFEPGDPKITIRNLFSKGNLVAAETEADGRLRNGNAYHNRYAWVIEIRDDKVYALREYMDTAYILEQLQTA